MSLSLGPVPLSLGLEMMRLHANCDHPRPLTLWSLLPYERCMSVLHLTMHKRQSECQNIESAMSEDGTSDKFDPDPIMAKEPMLYQVHLILSFSRLFYLFVL